MARGRWFVDRPRRSDCTAGHMEGETGWWTTSGNIGLPPLARVMGVGRQQQQMVSQILCGSAIETVHVHYGPFLLFLSPLLQGF